jgi:hypothetical protein
MTTGTPTWVGTLLPTYTVTGQGNGAVADQLLTSAGVVDYANKTGYVYYLKGSAIGAYGSNCGTQSSTFDGGADPGPPPQVINGFPGDMIGSKGNNVSMIGTQVETLGGCAAGTNIIGWTAGAPGCVMFLPMANGPVGGTGNTPTYVIPTMAPFYVWCNKSSTSGTTCQEFVGQLLQVDAIGNLITNISVTSGGFTSGALVVHLTQ